MAILEVTSRQFRENQRDFFDLADSGKQIVIRRGKKQAYALTPVDDDDLYFGPEMMKKIEDSMLQAKDGKVTTIKNKEELHLFLDSL
jgi:hypothetical protein